MSGETLLYPFLFLAIFFESFLLVTYLSKPARAGRRAGPPLSEETPRVAIIVPCWNEASTIGGTIQSLFALEYPAERLSFILVNDGSTDTTASVMERYRAHPQVTILHQKNGGKFTAMNAGLAHTASAELIGFLDADSFVAPDALREIVATFKASEETVAVAASMSIHEPHTILQRMQSAEYAFSIAVRHILASLNGLYVTPGPFSFYRQSVFAELGLFKHAHLAEDMEMAMRIQRAGYHIGYALRARVYTKGPPTFTKLIKQRVRWTTGFLRNILFDYRDLLGSTQNSTLGTFVLPLALFSVVGSILVFVWGTVSIFLNVWRTYRVVETVPLSYTLTVWHPLTWQTVPLTTITFLGVAISLTTFFWMYLGKTLSRTPGKLTLNVMVYCALYWIVAPLWLIRSVTEVLLGARTTWR